MDERSDPKIHNYNVFLEFVIEIIGASEIKFIALLLNWCGKLTPGQMRSQMNSENQHRSKNLSRFGRWKYEHSDTTRKRLSLTTYIFHESLGLVHAKVLINIITNPIS